jgi:hypothetical protein
MASRRKESLSFLQIIEKDISWPSKLYMRFTMKKRTLGLLVFVATTLAISAYTLVNSNGTQIGYTLSPPDGPGDCSSCHGGGSAIPVVSFSASPAFGPGNTYVPGTVYTLSYAVTGYPYFGFDLEMINGQLAASKDAGSGWTNVSGCRITPTGTYPTNISHSSPIASGSAGTWKWTAPASGNVYVYSSALGVNHDGGQNGDKVASYTLTLAPFAAGIGEQASNLNNLNLFPNPASGMIHLSYTLDKTSSVTVQVLDLSGKRVTELFNQHVAAGEQKFDANLPSELSKGVYLVSLSVNGIQSVKRLVIQ